MVAVDATADGVRLTVSTALAAGSISEGDSIAVNGVCLTATDLSSSGFTADVMHESLDRSSLGGLAEGSPVNLELALRAADRLGGHIMQGHVDGVGSVAAVREDGFARVVTIAPRTRRCCATSSRRARSPSTASRLTVARIDDAGFDVSLIPETLERTNLGAAVAGQRVNLEVDVLAKYVEKLLGTAVTDA